MDLNDPELEFSDLVYAYQSWVIAIINDEKLNSKEKLLTEELSLIHISEPTRPERIGVERGRV